MRELTEEEQARVAAAAQVVEAKTDAHFALVIVPASDRYALYPLAWAALLTVGWGGLIALARPALPIRQGFIAEAVAFLLLSLVFEWRPLRRFLVPHRVQHARARQLAHLEFAASILARRAPGLLFFVSRAERSIELIASHEVHEKVGEAEWNRIVGDFVAAVKVGRIADGFIAGISECGAHLERHFPAHTEETS